MDPTLVSERPPVARSPAAGRVAAAAVAWLPLAVLPAAALAGAPRAWPAWAVMWSLAVAIFAGCKWLTWRRTPVPAAPAWRHAGYLFAWPGLDAAAFLDSRAVPPRPRAGEWLFATVKLALGLVLLCGIARWVLPEYPYLVGWVGMVGIILVLHFGSFHLLSCAWRRIGVDARPLMNGPLAATGVSDYWGKRWNTAFRDLTHRFLFRPVAARVGPRWAIAAVFGFSGVVHDLVISVPAGGGYGGPTLFFLVQGAGVFAERSPAGRRLGLGRGARGWLFTMLLLAVPLAALFHPPFVVGVVVPFLHALGAV
jgi:hypothetical protein